MIELTGYAEHLRDEATHDDYVREAYGDPCPGCGSLRYGGDCGKCYDFEAEARDEDRLIRLLSEGKEKS